MEPVFFEATKASQSLRPQQTASPLAEKTKFFRQYKRRTGPGNGAGPSAYVMIQS